jgi:hypothetical protein
MEQKPKVRIFDGSFIPYVKSASLRKENKDVSPTYFEWTTEGEPTKTTFVANGDIKYVEKHLGDYLYPGVWDDRFVVALLTEPPDLHPENYQAAYDLHGYFSHVLTYSKEWHEKMDGLVGNTRFYALGGSSIAFDKWGMYPKTKDICMILSDKKTTEGHKLRHQIYEKYKDSGLIDFYGAGAGKPFEGKFEILKDYRYCVVVESCQIDYYWTEKLIDPISVGTIPIYWGCLSIGKWFDVYGMQRFKTINEIEMIFDNFANWDMHKEHRRHIQKNLNEAKKYRICEDFIYQKYPELFHDNTI